MNSTNENRVLKLDEVRAYTKPLYVWHRRNTLFRGWAMYDGEKGPYLKFKTFDTRILIPARDYGADWLCRTDEPPMSPDEGF